MKRCPCQHLALILMSPPQRKNWEVALSKMKRDEVGRKSGILPELVPFGGTVLWDPVAEVDECFMERRRKWYIQEGRLTAL